MMTLTAALRLVGSELGVHDPPWDVVVRNIMRHVREW